MKKNYYLFMIMAFFTANVIHAQFVCPELLGNQTTTTTIHFKINAGTCASYNQNIFVTYQGVGITFTKSTCNGTNLQYVSTGGSLSDPDDFIVSFPNNGTCQYVNGTLVTLSDDEVSFNDKVSVYPNPLLKGDLITVKFKSNLSAKFEIYNVAGKLVSNDLLSNQNSKEISTNNLTNGIYLLKISTDEASTTRKIVIMK
ncbi:putative secreted protein (Por secretion system target) [Flavobacteriaceae bacterium MAR_2010_72]|nr:putative secreted protein (Por secretion system target) [Flavobacteriaceae bacterium MAR_2010_72]TVZ60264.1 putative secreted protein (Por secretion system target) [Flavobacteriaceae bacterium MAR_2010_105]